MNLPGFTAETSLYRTTEHYRTASAHEPINGMIYPAQMDYLGNKNVVTTPQYGCEPTEFCAFYDGDYWCPYCWECTTTDANCKKDTYRYCDCIGV